MILVQVYSLNKHLECKNETIYIYKYMMFYGINKILTYTVNYRYIYYYVYYYINVYPIFLW